MHRGFTLVELILSFSLIAFLSGLLGVVVFQTLQYQNKLRLMHEVTYQAQTMLDQIGTNIRTAQSVTTPATNTSSSALTLVVADGTKSPTQWYLSNNQLFKKEGTAAALPITTSQAKVSNLTFTSLSASGTPPSLRIQMTLNQSATSTLWYTYYEDTFSSTVTLRPL